MMSFGEAKEVFINRAFIQTDDGTGRIHDPEKWREACYVLTKWLEQEPCSNVISREAALEAIFNIGMCKCSTQEVEAVSECLGAVEALPPVVTGQWIPVSEKPKEAGCYMTTVDHGEYGLAAGQRFYHKDIEEWSDACVIAWMPLPEPYKPQESEV